MSRRLESELADIKGRFGITLDDLKADEIERLVLACRRCDNPFSEVNLDLVEAPIRVCKGVYIHPITAGAQIWLEEYASRWWTKSSSMLRWARVYALAHARDPEAFSSLTDKWKARKAILRTMLRFVCHKAELMEAMRRAYGCADNLVDDDKSMTERSQTDFAALVALLEVKSGIKAREWLWGKSFVALGKAYVEMRKFAAAYSMKEFKRMTDELDEAINDLARVKVSISRRLEAERMAKEETK